MEVDKRKRKDDRETNGKAGEEDDGVKREITAPEDEEVEEFFAILKRIKVAVKYFKNRNGSRELTATAWNPLFERQDFEGLVKKDSEENVNAGLDLNSDPGSDVSYSSV